MKAAKTVFLCSNCGNETPRWQGRCPSCGQWNTLEEYTPPQAAAPSRSSLSNRTSAARGAGVQPKRLNEVTSGEELRFGTGLSELDRVLGGGAVRGSLVLVSGAPGIGKSTLLLQVCRNLAAAGKRVLYISGEESLKQIRLRAERIGDMTGELYFLCETALGRIEEEIKKLKPDVAVIDSIQTMFCDSAAAAPGSVSQVRESTSLLMQIAKGLGVAMFIVGHVTKEGVVAGPGFWSTWWTRCSTSRARGTQPTGGAGGQEPFWLHQRDRRLRDDGGGPYGGAEPVGVHVERPAGGGFRGCGGLLHGGDEAHSYRGAGAGHQDQFGMPRRTAAGVDYNRDRNLHAPRRCWKSGAATICPRWTPT